jgi:glutamate-1-semialdehyde 2,1-aminomutase
MNTGGIHLTYGVNPDIAVFAKAIANGYPMAAVIGTRPIMESAQTSFISSTLWTEGIGPAAAIATISKHRERNVARHLIEVGTGVQKGWRRAAQQTGLKIHVSGIPPLSHFEIECEHPAAASTLFIQEMLDKGYLASNSLYASYAHEPHHVDRYVSSCGEAFDTINRAIEAGDLMARLRGPVKHSGFQRLN